jgi:hypothetical protein
MSAARLSCAKHGGCSVVLRTRDAADAPFGLGGSLNVSAYSNVCESLQQAIPQHLLQGIGQAQNHPTALQERP